MGYARVNGVDLYYEEHGAGQPLILVHGGLGSGEMFGPILPTMAEGRRVITVDLQAHGRTADVDRPLRHESLGDDLAYQEAYAQATADTHRARQQAARRLADLHATLAPPRPSRGPSAAATLAPPRPYR